MKIALTTGVFNTLGVCMQFTSSLCTVSTYVLSLQADPEIHTLEEALLSGDINWLEKSLAEGLDVNIPDENGHTPLIMAAQAGQIEVGI